MAALAAAVVVAGVGAYALVDGDTEQQQTRGTTAVTASTTPPPVTFTVTESRAVERSSSPSATSTRRSTPSSRPGTAAPGSTSPTTPDCAVDPTAPRIRTGEEQKFNHTPAPGPCDGDLH